MIELASLNEENMRLHQEVGRLKIQLQEARFELAEVNSQLQENLEALSSLKQEKDGWGSATKDLEMTISHLETGMKKLEDDLATAKEEKQGIANDKEKMDRLLTQVEEENYRLKQQYKRTKHSLS